MLELISGIDNFAKGLMAPIRSPHAHRGCARRGELPEGHPQPG